MDESREAIAEAKSISSPTQKRRRLVSSVEQLPVEIDDLEGARATEEMYKFQVRHDYMSLIDWNDPDDPIRKLIIPDRRELIPVSGMDTADELEFTVVPGLQHKFRETALMIFSKECASYCRYCFRKRLFQPSNSELLRDINDVYFYLCNHPEITNVIISGGDAMMDNVNKLSYVLNLISSIESVKIIRIGTKVPAFYPEKIIDNRKLFSLIESVCKRNVQVYVMAHFDHPREVTEKTRISIKQLHSSGAACLNQCPLLRGVNSDVGVLGELFDVMSFIGCPQYYVFHCRPTDGNRHFILPLAEAFEIFEREVKEGSGLAKCGRYCISDKSGKLHVLARDGENIILKYIDSPERALVGKLVTVNARGNRFDV